MVFADGFGESEDNAVRFGMSIDATGSGGNSSAASFGKSDQSPPQNHPGEEMEVT